MGAKNYIYIKTDVPEYAIEKNDTGYIIKEDSQTNYCEVSFLRTGINLLVEKTKLGKFLIEETGDRFDKKVCDRCYKYLDTETEFENNRLKKNNVMTKRPSCRSCRKIKDGVKIPSKQRKEWEAKKPSNGSLFTCPICHKTTIVGVSKIVLDHNHSTGDVRGWLCESCNTGIGRFDDSSDLLHHAITWLEDTETD